MNIFTIGPKGKFSAFDIAQWSKSIIETSPFVCRARSGIKKLDYFEYQATTEDPYFSYYFWFRRPRYMVVLLERLDHPLDPKIYSNRGGDFNEDDTISLQHAGSCIYTISISEPRRISAIRVDPVSVATKFRYWAGCAWTQKGLQRLLIYAQQRAQTPVPPIEIVVDGNPTDRKLRKMTSSVAGHYASVITLAQRTSPRVIPTAGDNAPFISFVVPVYNTPARYLSDLLASFMSQPFGSAELILSDDGSVSVETRAWFAVNQSQANVRFVRSTKNLGIAAATNAGIAVARGEWIGLVDHDDALSPHAVQLIAETARDHPGCKFIYTDEVVTNAQLKPIHYFLKPAYDDVLLSGVNYINHLSCYRRGRLISIGGLREGFDGSQDYDLLLRYLSDLKPEEVKHLPYPAYLWRRSDRAFSAQFLAQSTTNARKALASRYRSGESEILVDPAIAKSLHRVRFDSESVEWPRVSVVIPNRDSFPLISRVLEDLRHRTNYPNLEIVVSDNGSTDPCVLDLYRSMGNGQIPFKFEIQEAPFNFARQVNRGIALASGGFILVLNNDIEVMEADWLREMVSCFKYSDTGIVGARLIYPSGRIQHAGVIVGLGGLAGHWFIGKRTSFPGPIARLHVRQSMTAVTGACMLISRSCLEAVGNFDEEEFAIAYNDIDYCLRAAKAGFRTMWTPFATLTHHESASRGSDETFVNQGRFDREKKNLRLRHHTDTFDDRFFSPWYTRDRSEPGLRLLDRLPKAR